MANTLSKQVEYVGIICTGRWSLEHKGKKKPLTQFGEIWEIFTREKKGDKARWSNNSLEEQRCGCELVFPV